MNFKVPKFIFRTFLLGSIFWPQFSLVAKAQDASTLGEAEEMIILAPAKINEAQRFLDEKRSKVSAGDGSSAAQISRQGDSNAASAVKRITGVTIIDDKYAVIRGLGERYSSTRLNGFFLPSMEQNRRQFALNIFPTSTLSGIEVEKSYLSPWPSSFSGGLINLKTNPAVNSDSLRLQMSFGYQELPSNFYRSKDSRDDYLANDLGSRALPKAINKALKNGRALVEASPSVPEGFSKSELRQFSQDMTKNYDLEAGQSSSVIPRFQVQGGREVSWSLFRLKTLNALAYSQSDEFENSLRENYDISSGQSLVLSDRNMVDRYKTEQALSVQSTNLLEFSSAHQLKVDFYGIRRGTESSQVRTKSGPGVNDFQRKETLIEFNQRNLFGLQLQNFYSFSSEHRMQLGFARNQIRTETPDSRQYTYRSRSRGDALEFDPEVSGNSRSWSDLNENANEYKLEYQWGEASSPRLSLGLQSLDRSRKTTTARFQFVKDYTSGEAPDLKRNLDSILNESEKWILLNQTQAADAYQAQALQRGAYYLYRQDISSEWKIFWGQRFEENEVTVDNIDSFTAKKMNGTEARYSSILPSLSLLYTPTDNQKWIFAYGETLVIPDFRELSAIRYYDDEEGLEAKGNIALKPTEVKNFDLRYEVYPHVEEVLSLGVFAKDFVNPIEDTFLPIAGGVVRYPQNIERAGLYGVEGEMRLSARKWMRELRFVHLSLNGSLMKSEVQIAKGSEGSLTNTRRPMQGQSDWILNGEVYYQRDPKGILLSVSYNVAGPRIYAVGTEGRPDALEKEFHQLDFAGSYNFDKSSKLGLRLRNVLDSERKLYMGPHQSFSLKTGPEFSISYAETL